MATILITHGLPAEDFCALEGHEIIIPGLYGAFSEAELIQLIPEADAVVAGGKLPGDEEFPNFGGERGQPQGVFNANPRVYQGARGSRKL